MIVFDVNNTELPSTRRRPGIREVAQAAGVSTATVDRVLNQRPGVRAATVQAVFQAAAELRYLPQADLYRALQPHPMRLLFLLPAGTNRYLNMLGDYAGATHDHTDPFNVQCRSRFVEGFDPRILAATLLREGKRADGIAFMALEHPVVREAVNQLADRGVHTITLISDLSRSARAAYVGLDNRAAGRSAGLLMGRFIGPRSGRVAMIAGSRHYRGHEEREMGFQDVLYEKFPALQVIGLKEGHDDAAINYRQARQLLDQYPDLAGIYNIGGAADGVGKALKDAGRDQDIVFIGHGLTPDTRGLLIDGTMDALLNQNLQSTILSTVRIFANVRAGREPMAGIEPMQISVVFSENLP
ncbi:LacI family DNA-binding transcriptional regulator [Castellaniella sp.]|uniref:LacI family DNA-binding transcriptional regulator n=1 Tax=Castellaniella sp. TaxID=1955812 RepID=UPI003C75F96A